MLHFAFAIYSIVFTTFSVAVIVMGYFSWTSMISCIIAGAIISIPTPAQFLRIARSRFQKVHWTF